MPKKINSAKRAIDKIPNWNSDAVTIKQLLSDGPSNSSWRVQYEGLDYVLRQDKEFVHQLPLNRKNEGEILALTSQENLSQKLVYANADNGILLTEYVDGSSLTPAQLHSKETLEKIAIKLKHCHSLKPDVLNYDLEKSITRYSEIINTAQATKWTQEITSLLKQSSKRPFVLCHNDLLVQNILLSHEQIVFIDWEYAGLGNPLFDVATIINQNKLTEEETECFLDAYCPERDIDFIADLNFYIKICERLLALWYALLIHFDKDVEYSTQQLDNVIAHMHK